jgi:hypothetical protein
MCTCKFLKQLLPSQQGFSFISEIKVKQLRMRLNVPSEFRHASEHIPPEALVLSIQESQFKRFNCSKLICPLLPLQRPLYLQPWSQQ